MTAARCVTCARFDLRRHPAMAAQGFGVCSRGPNYQHHPAEREHDCAHHLPAPDEAATARRQWLAKREQKAAP